MSMTHRSLHFVAARLRRLDEDEGGAILLACLAGCLIVFMVSLTMYDAGNVTREKIKLQTATDSAAYSQAAVKARTMNTNAYVNVTKRSIVGIQLTYFSAQNYFFTDMWTRVPTCFTPSAPHCTILYEPITNCSVAAQSQSSSSCLSGDKCCNLVIVTTEHQRDFALKSASATNTANFGGDYEFESDTETCLVDPDPSDPNADSNCVAQPQPPTNPLRNLYIATTPEQAVSLEAARLHGAMDKYTKELRQLTRYQEYMQVITPWWAFSEALARATHNGATMATTYPAPAGLNTSAATGSYPIGPGPDDTMDDDWSWPAPSGMLSDSGNATLAIQFSSQAGHMCSEFTGGSDSTAPFRDPLFNEEIGIHVDTLQRNSEGAVKSSDVYANQVFAGDNLTANFKTIGGYSMCFMMHFGRYSSHVPPSGSKPPSSQGKNTRQAGKGVVPLFDPTYSTPYLLSIDPQNSELARMRLSNIVFGYREGSDYRRDVDDSGTGMTRFEYMTQDYENSLPENARGTGIWTMARGEIVTLGGSDGNWHSAWTARVRPISRPGELNDVELEMGISTGSFLNNAFRTATPYLRVNEQIAHTGDISELHPEVWVNETKTMERATKAMDSNSSGGMFK